MDQKEKVIIFSHESDIDGLGSIVLGKLAYDDIDYVLVPNINILETKFREYIENGLFDKYDKVFVTDLALYNPSLEMVSKDPVLSKKVLVFDHHKSAISENCNAYSFTTIIDEDENGIKRCGTDLFYQYLYSNGILKRTKILDEFVELTRLEDNWEWKNDKEKGVKAHDMAILLNGIGIEKYIKNMYIKMVLNNDYVEFSEEEAKIIEDKKKEYIEKLQNIWDKREYFKDENNNRFAVVFADYEYRNELSEYVRGLHIEDLKYLIIIALEKGTYGQKSYRAIAKGFDVGKIAESHGGSGHPGAAAVNITKEQREKAMVLRREDNRTSLEYLINSNYSN